MTGNGVQPNRLRGGVPQPNQLGAARHGRDPSGVARDARSDAGAAATRPFGPNSDAVLRILAAVQHLSPVEAQRLTSFWKAVPDELRDHAHENMQSAARSSGRRDETRAAQEAAMFWLDEAAQETLDWGQPGSTIGRVQQAAQIRREAFPAILDTVAGAALADVLDPATLEVLVGPWQRAFGEEPGEERTQEPRPAQD